MSRFCRIAPRLVPVFELLVNSTKSLKEMAFELGLTPQTIKDYSHKIYDTYSVTGRVELIYRYGRGEVSLLEPNLEEELTLS